MSAYPTNIEALHVKVCELLACRTSIPGDIECELNCLGDGETVAEFFIELTPGCEVLTLAMELPNGSVGFDGDAFAEALLCLLDQHGTVLH